MVRDEPVASVLAEAFEGFANGRFENRMDVHVFWRKVAFSLPIKKGWFTAHW